MKNNALCWSTARFQAYTSKLLPTLIYKISILVQNLVGKNVSKTHFSKKIIFTIIRAAQKDTNLRGVEFQKKYQLLSKSMQVWQYIQVNPGQHTPLESK